MNTGKIMAAAIAIIFASLTFLSCGNNSSESDRFIIKRDEQGRWTEATANRWWSKQAWPVGCNFVPSTAINQLEMWQADTFDPETIDRELGWAADLGFNVMRVFLHNLLWEQDPTGFVERINSYLEIADRHGIKTMFVLFDNVWDPEPQLGPQPAPVAGVHNSGWVQSPASAETIAFAEDAEIRNRLENYVKGIVGEFAADRRIFMWDLVNEPGNSFIGAGARPLVEASFKWAREIEPSQPLTAGVWQQQTTSDISLFQIEQSDIVSFHSYDDADDDRKLIEEIKKITERPLICTEYMARTVDSLFETHLPLFAEFNIGAIHWGLVYGKTQTIFPWGSFPGAPEPEVWFHDIFYPDGSPYDAAEVEFITNFIAETLAKTD